MPLVSQPQVNHRHHRIAGRSTNPPRRLMADRRVVCLDRNLGQHRLAEISLRGKVIEECDFHIIALFLHRIPQCLP
ncbi:MAG: hypothetical protein EBR10_00295 [Planctomycetes bacterium]|nr:hypothetical protein [Planctomycetota bacterium]